MTPSPFHLVSLGWGGDLIAGLLDRVEEHTGQQLSHILLTPLDRESLSDRPDRTSFHYLREDIRAELPEPDLALLGSLEQPGVPTLHTMILSDRAVRHLDYAEALKYATCLARRLMELLETLRPSVVLGAFDGLHGAIAFAVARKLGIPWFAMQFSTVPKGLSCFCDGLTPDTDVTLSAPPVRERRASTVSYGPNRPKGP